MNKKVSIIIPLYNCERYIADAIESVLAQTYTDWEILLVDDNSTDNSAEIISVYADRDQRIKYFHLDKNGGAAKARNVALGKADGRFIAYLDADDVWLPEKLERQITFMEENGVIFTCCDYACIDSDGTPLNRIIHMPQSYTYKQLLKNTVIQTVGVIVDTEYVNKNLLLMPDIRRGQDSATWMKLLKNGVAFHGQNEVLAQYRRVLGSLSSNKWSAAKRTWYLLRNIEHLSVPKAFWCMIHWMYHVGRRRIFLPSGILSHKKLRCNFYGTKTLHKDATRCISHLTAYSSLHLAHKAEQVPQRLRNLGSSKQTYPLCHRLLKGSVHKSQIKMLYGIARRIYRVILNMTADQFGAAFAKQMDACFRFHRCIHLKNPVSLSDKLSYSELFHHDPLKVICSDKYAVRQYCEEKGLGDILVPFCHDACTSIYDINFDALPSQFVMKATHGSGMNLICENKNNLKEKTLLNAAGKWLDSDYGRACVEPHYKYIPHKIIFESYLGDPEYLTEYKIHCFHGLPDFILTCRNRITGIRLKVYTPTWKSIDVVIDKLKDPYPVPKPKTLNRMLEISKILSSDFDFVRVDLYEVKGHIYFGELTFSPSSCVFSDFSDDFLIEKGRLLENQI